MPRKVGRTKTVQFSITLPTQVVANMRLLEGTGYFGSSRGEVARELILAHLQHLGAQVIADALSRKAKKRTK